MTFYAVQVWKIAHTDGKSTSYDTWEVKGQFFKKENALKFVKNDLFRLKKYKKFQDLKPDKVVIMRYDEYISEDIDL